MPTPGRGGHGRPSWRPTLCTCSARFLFSQDSAWGTRCQSFFLSPKLTRDDAGLGVYCLDSNSLPTLFKSVTWEIYLILIFLHPSPHYKTGLIMPPTVRCCAGLSLSVVSDSLRPRGPWPARLLCPWGFSRQKYWNGLPFPPRGDHPNPGSEPRSLPLQAESLLPESPGK